MEALTVGVPWMAASAAFALALLGAVHCVGMCGGFVAAIQFNRAPQVGALQLSIGYHLGRLTSYVTGGVLVGTLGGALYASQVRPLQVALLAAGGLSLLAIGAAMFTRGKLLRRLEPLGVALWRLIAPMARHVVPPRRMAHAWLAGVAWGWIPCGMVYAALPLALAAGGPMQGALVMLAFGLGTLPGLLALDLGVSRLAVASGPHGTHAAPWVHQARPWAGVAIVGFGAASLAYAAQAAGVDHPAVAWLASLCVTH